MDENKKMIKTCPFIRTCGACSYIGTSYEDTLKRKEAEVRKLLKPFVGLMGMEGMENPYHYRNKVNRVCVTERHGRREEMKTGVYVEGTHRLVPIRSCLIEDEHCEVLIRDLEELTKSFHIPYYEEDRKRGLLRHILIRTAHTTGEIMVVLVLAGYEFPGKKHFVKLLREQHPEITTLVFNRNERTDNMILGNRDTKVYGPGYITDSLLGKSFRISPRSFYQVNSVMTEKIYSEAVDFACLTGTEKVIDAYCGIGTIGICLADRASEVIGIESNRDAVRDAVKNAALNGLSNISFKEGDASDYMMRMAAENEHADLILLDPPRSGTTERFVEAAAAVGPEKMIYISCNPETLARDLRLFKAKGYHAARAKAFDAFSWTPHVETVVLLTRNT